MKREALWTGIAGEAVEKEMYGHFSFDFRTYQQGENKKLPKIKCIDHLMRPSDHGKH